MSAILGLLLCALSLSPVASAEMRVEDCEAWLANTPEAWRALPPATLEALRMRLAQGEPPLYLWQGSLVCDHIEATLCTEAQGRGDCAELRFGDPERGCERPSEGPFCLTLRGDAQTPSVVPLIEARLADWPIDSVWRSIERDGQPVAGGAAGAEGTVEPALWPLALSLLALLVCVLFGLLWGRVERLSLLARALLPALIGLLVARAFPGVSTWDLVLAGLVCGVTGYARGRYGPLTKGVGLRVLAATLFSLVLGEVAVRWVLPAPAPMPPPQAARLYFEPEARELACQALYPVRFPDALPPLSEEGERVLHLGDSMVEGREVAPGERFTALINAEDAGRVHLNAGFSGTGPDHHLRVLRAWWPIVAPKAVVLYLYPGNDLIDLDRDYACCGHGPLLDEGLSARCEAPEWSFPLAALLARSPAPYVLRAASGHSHFAAHLSAGFSRVVEGLEPRLGDAAGEDEGATVWGRYSEVIVAIEAYVKSQGARLDVVILPTRAALEPEGEANHALVVGDRIAEVLRVAEIPSLDARQMFRTLGRDGSYGHLFSDQGPYNEHLGVRGHRALANWLQGRLSSD